MHSYNDSRKCSTNSVVLNIQFAAECEPNIRWQNDWIET